MAEDQDQHDAVPDAGEVTQLLWAHADATADRIVAALGGPLTPHNLKALLDAGDYLRYPTSVTFDRSPLEAHQFAEPVFAGEGAERRCTLYVDPFYHDHPDCLPHIVAYMAAAILYGGAADAALCEHLGAMLVQQTEDQFYSQICAIADLRDP